MSQGGRGNGQHERDQLSHKVTAAFSVKRVADRFFFPEEDTQAQGLNPGK